LREAGLHNLRSDRQAGIVKALRITCTNDHLCCDYCHSREGQEIPLAQCSADSLPPFDACTNSAGCRCYGASVLKDAEQKIIDAVVAKTRRGFVALALSAVLLVASSLIAGCGPAASTLHAGQAAKTKVKDPYPECAAIRQWLKDRNGDPDSIEVVSWDGRAVMDKDTPFFTKGTVTVRVTFRGANTRGGKQVWTYYLSLDSTGKPQTWQDVSS
jgi:hypothetical protein